jgi:hypothetical protein
MIPCGNDVRVSEKDTVHMMSKRYTGGKDHR